MHLHYQTLFRQILTLNDLAAGKTIADAFTQRKNEWILQLADDEGCLQLCTDAQYPYLLFLARSNRGKNSADVMTELAGKTIESFSLLPGERIAEVSFVDWEHRLLLQFFTARSNFFLIDGEGMIVNAFKGAKKFVGTPFELPENAIGMFPGEDAAEWKRYLEENGELPLLKSFRRFQYFSRPVVKELLHRCDLAENISCEEAVKDAENIRNQANALIAEMENGAPRIYYQNELPESFSLIALNHLKEREEKQFDDINTALRTFCFQSLKFRGLIQKKTHFSRILAKKIQSLQFSLKKLRNNPQDPAKKEYFQKIGQLLIAQPHLLEKGEGKVTLIDYYDAEMPEFEVVVKPTLSAKENAEIYFQKARRYQERGEEHALRETQMNEQIELLEGLQAQLKDADTFKAISKIEGTLKSRHLLAYKAEESQFYRLPYKQYEKNGFDIWVGRSAKDNDTLTFKHANKEDIWLHVQGYSGSHVVVRNPGKRDQIPPEVLQYAARLAVSFSTAKHASYVPVVYTHIKYVRKPRKSAPGSVLPTQVKTLFADPL